MKSNEFLYGQEVEVPEIPEYVIMRRVELLKEHLEELLSVDWKSRDGARCNAVLKSIDFWEKINTMG